MKVRRAHSVLLFVVSLPLVSGCFSAALSSEDAKHASRLVVVPVESPPALVMGYTREEGAGLLLGTGAIGVAIQEGVTRDARRVVAGHLNELMQIELQARLLDIATGRILAKGSTVGRSEPGKIEPPEPAARRRFEQQYRTAAGSICAQMLAEMRMIVGETRP